MCELTELFYTKANQRQDKVHKPVLLEYFLLNIM